MNSARKVLLGGWGIFWCASGMCHASKTRRRFPEIAQDAAGGAGIKLGDLEF